MVTFSNNRVSRPPLDELSTFAENGCMKTAFILFLVIGVGIVVTAFILFFKMLRDHLRNMSKINLPVEDE